MPPDHLALFQPRGGFLLPEQCISAHVEGALAAGASIRARERVLGWEPIGDGVRVTTERGVYEGGRLILAAGAWMASLVPGPGRPRPTRTADAGLVRPARSGAVHARSLPRLQSAGAGRALLRASPLRRAGVKIGLYHHLEEQIDPDDYAREAGAADEEPLRLATARYFPAANGPTMALRTCMFTNTPDEHFILDLLPGCPQVIVASPCSGHGFKFASVIGEILADLAQSGETGHDIDWLRLGRFRQEAASVL